MKKNAQKTPNKGGFDSYSEIQEDLLRWNGARGFNKRWVKPPDLYWQDALARKIVDFVVDDVMRLGWKLDIRDQRGEVSSVHRELEGQFQRLDVYRSLGQALKVSRLYGTAYLLLVREGQDFTRPAEESPLLSLRTLTPLQIKPLEETINDPRCPGFGYPLYYGVQSEEKIHEKDERSSVSIHHSHIIRFDNAHLGLWDLRGNGYVGHSCLEGVESLLVNYRTVLHKVQRILENFQVAVYRTDLSEIAGDSNGVRTLKNRLRLIAKSKEEYNIIALDQNDNFEIKEHQFPSVVDLLSKMEQTLVMNTGYPHTVLLGDSPSGLGATGNSESRNYSAFVSQVQENQLYEGLKTLCETLLHSNGMLENPVVTPVFHSFLEEMQQDRDLTELDRLSQTVSRDLASGVLSLDQAKEVLRRHYDKLLATTT